MQEIAHHSFWDFNIGNLVTVAGVLAMWLMGRVQENAVLIKRMEIVEKAQDTYEKQTVELDRAVIKLTTLAESTDRRLNFLENTQFERRRVPR